MKKFYIHLHPEQYADIAKKEEQIYKDYIFHNHEKLDFHIFIQRIPKKSFGKYIVASKTLRDTRGKEIKLIVYMTKDEYMSAQMMIYTDFIHEAIKKGKDYETDKNMYEALSLARKLYYTL